MNYARDIHIVEYFSAIKKKKQNKTQNTDTCKNMDIFQMHYAKWKKPDSKGYILYEYIYMIFWKQSDRK